MRSKHSILISVTIVATILLSQVAYIWDGEFFFYDLNNFINGLFLLFYSIIIHILANGVREKRAAFLLILLNLIFTFSYLSICLT